LERGTDSTPWRAFEIVYFVSLAAHWAQCGGSRSEGFHSIAVEKRKFAWALAEERIGLDMSANLYKPNPPGRTAG
jgi:hypothetical protein